MLILLNDDGAAAAAVLLTEDGPRRQHAAMRLYSFKTLYCWLLVGLLRCEIIGIFLILVSLQDSSTSMMNWDPMGKCNKIAMDNNPFLTRTPSVNAVDMQGIDTTHKGEETAGGNSQGRGTHRGREQPNIFPRKVLYTETSELDQNMRKVAIAHDRAGFQ